MAKRILLVDNYDSFTFNLFQLVAELSGEFPTVARNDEVDLEAVLEFDAVILSPGPGIPSEAGLMPELLKRFAGRLPILGVCLGHQAIAERFGGTLVNLDSVFHGVALETVVTVEDEPLFATLPAEFPTGRYHSWVVSEVNLPKELVVTSRDLNGNVMSLRHRDHNIAGVQFHPESVMTPDGGTIMTNWLRSI